MRRAGPRNSRARAAVGAGRLVPVPAAIAPKPAAAGLLQATTAHFLACPPWPLERGQIRLVHAAGEGVGPRIPNRRGALFLTRPSRGPATYSAGSPKRKPSLRIDREALLAEAAAARRALEARKTTGKVPLIS